MLIADIGGTRARFGVSSEPGIIDRMLERETGAAPLDETLAEVTAALGPDAKTGRAVFAVAGAVADGRAKLTNAGWTLDRADLAALLGAEVTLINDFEAIALALPLLADGCVKLGGGAGDPAAPMLAFGPGTGLGVAACVPVAAGYTVIAGEGGHVTLAPRTIEENAVLLRMRARYPHVSAERIVSGPGLETLHDVRCGLQMDAATIAKAARAGIPDALASVHVFTDFMATVAADAVLTFGARGGLYLTGGVLAGLGTAFEPARFLKRFTDKGRFSDYLAAVPVFKITYPQPGLLGLTALR